MRNPSALGRRGDSADGFLWCEADVLGPHRGKVIFWSAGSAAPVSLEGIVADPVPIRRALGDCTRKAGRA